MTGVAIALMIPAAGSLVGIYIMVLPANVLYLREKPSVDYALLAAVIGFVGMVSGLILSYYPDTPVSATITLLFVSFCSQILHLEI